MIKKLGLTSLDGCPQSNIEVTDTSLRKLDGPGSLIVQMHKPLGAFCAYLHKRFYDHFLQVHVAKNAAQVEIVVMTGEAASLHFLR